MMIRDDQTGSIWAHTEGVAVAGPLKGTVLRRFPCFQTIWKEWRAEHPETQVLSWPEIPTHRDPRHGHGSKDYLGRPGIRAGRAFGLGPGDLDLRLSENELLLGVSRGTRARAYPLAAVHRQAGVINDEIDQHPIVIWAPHLDSHWIAGFSRHISGLGVMTFRNAQGVPVDLETGSHWSIEGFCLEGDLAGAELLPLDSLLLKWHAWAGFHPETEIWKGSNLLAVESLPLGVQRESVERLRAAEFRVEIEGLVVEALLPNLALWGLRLRIDDAPHRFFEFRDSVGALEFTLTRPHTRRAGCLVVEDYPDLRFRDTAQLEALAEDEMKWSDLPGNARMKAIIGELSGSVPVAPAQARISFQELLDGLRDKGYRLSDIDELEGRRLRTGSDNGFSTRINDDPFLVYRFQDPARAASFASWHGHSFVCGRFVFRSDPEKQYKHSGLQATDLPQDQIEWSPLVRDQEFRSMLGQICE